MTESATVSGTVNPEHDLRGVLRVPAFRKLWTALSLSSFGDWLGLLALTALAPRLAGGGYAAANVAIASASSTVISKSCSSESIDRESVPFFR